MPERVKVPEPCLTSEPLLPLITPAKVVLEVSPTVKVLLPKFTELLAAPVNEPMVSEALSNKVALEVLKFTALVSARAEPLESASVPALTVVVPV